ncbi:MAG: dihydropteroate synthase [Haloferacaceae archaeon]
MKYHEAADFLFDLRRFQVNPGTEAVRDLLAHLGDPHEDTAFVQVGGSNGKGSVSRMTESILRAAGYDVGLYTSPHLDDVRERIRVDGRKITERALCEFVEAARPFLTERAADGEPLTFFETMTAMALWQFGRADVDVAVLEIGMGGKLDATSVVDPVASAVVSVALEHTGVLGDTVEEIATKKAAIAPAGAPLVTGATGTALDVLRREAGDVVTVGPVDGDDAAESGDDDAPDVTARYRGLVNRTEAGVDLRGPDWELEATVPLLGRYQAVNAGVAATLARQVAGEGGALVEAGNAASVDDATVARGLRAAHWPGRFEVLRHEPLLVLDGAHNPSAVEAVAETLGEFDYDDLHLVFASMHDKDYREMATSMPAASSVITCKPNLARAEDPEVLARVFEQHVGADTDVRAGDSVAAALARAKNHAAPGDCVLVLGSLFAVAEARTAETRLEIPKAVDDLNDATRTLDDAHVAGRSVWQIRGEGVHRVLKTRVDRRQARRLKEELLTLGGECAVSSVQNDGELLDVVLMGTLAEFEGLTENLAGEPYGLPGIAREIRGTLGIGAADEPAGWPWEEGTAVMGILNVTPDSFHDGGRFAAVDDAVERAEEMVANGVDIIDVGGESTRPGADPVPVEEEKRRVVPVIERIADLDALLSVDTRRAEVGRAALDAGADVLNDVTGLADPEMRFLAAERDVPIVVMHSLSAPVDPGREAEYDDVVEDVIEELADRVLLAEKAGVPREHVIVDPGLGFGKSKAENFELLSRLGEFDALGCPILVGHSHKSMFDLIGRDADERLASTVATTALAADRGADVVRVHDVKENVAAVRAAEATDDPGSFSRE